MAFNLTPASILSNVVTASNLLSSLAKIDVVAVLDQESFQQVFGNFRPMKASVRETSRVMDYPVETGAILSDHKIILPTEIQMAGMIKSEFYASAYAAIRNAWINSTLLSVQTRTGTYRNMIVADMPHEEDPDAQNAVMQFIRFREVQFGVPSSVVPAASLSNYSPIDPRNNPTVSRGLLSAATAGSSAYSYFRALSVWGL